MIYIELFAAFALIGFTSFGGLSMISLINEQMIEHGWMTMQELADILAIAEMTPGPLGMNCATFAGARTADAGGALVAMIGVLLPSLTVCMAVAVCMERFKKSSVMKRALYGIRPACVGITAVVVIRQSIANCWAAGTGVSWVPVVIGGVAFVMLLYKKWSVPKTIIWSAVLGLLFGGLGF